MRKLILEFATNQYTFTLCAIIIVPSIIFALGVASERSLTAQIVFGTETLLIHWLCGKLVETFR